VTEEDLTHPDIQNVAVATGKNPGGGGTKSPPSTSVVTVVPPHGALAATGVPVMQTVVWGLALIVLGCMLVALTMRSGRRRRT